MCDEAAPSSGEFQEVEGETEERRRARFERHQRTLERAVSTCFLILLCKLTYETDAWPLFYHWNTSGSIFSTTHPYNMVFLSMFFCQAKALAEKNERDMQTKRDQEERHVSLQSQ